MTRIRFLFLVLYLDYLSNMNKKNFSKFLFLLLAGILGLYSVRVQTADHFSPATKNTSFSVQQGNIKIAVFEPVQTEMAALSVFELADNDTDDDTFDSVLKYAVYTSLIFFALRQLFELMRPALNSSRNIHFLNSFRVIFLRIIRI